MNTFFYFFCGFVALVIYGFCCRKQKDYYIEYNTIFLLLLFGIFSLFFSIIFFTIYFNNNKEKQNII